MAKHYQDLIIGHDTNFQMVSREVVIHGASPSFKGFVLEPMEQPVVPIKLEPPNTCPIPIGIGLDEEGNFVQRKIVFEEKPVRITIAEAIRTRIKIKPDLKLRVNSR